jgi:hypothetical protein
MSMAVRVSVRFMRFLIDRTRLNAASPGFAKSDARFLIPQAGSGQGLKKTH